MRSREKKSEEQKEGSGTDSSDYHEEWQIALMYFIYMSLYIDTTVYREDYMRGGESLTPVKAYNYGEG